MTYTHTFTLVHIHTHTVLSLLIPYTLIHTLAQSSLCHSHTSPLTLSPHSGEKELVPSLIPREISEIFPGDPNLKRGVFPLRWEEAEAGPRSHDSPSHVCRPQRNSPNFLHPFISLFPHSLTYMREDLGTWQGTLIRPRSWGALSPRETPGLHKLTE